MLTSLLGIRLILWIGRAVPVPAPYVVSIALVRVEVTNDAETEDGFQLTFTLGKDPASDYSLLQSRILDPMTKVAIGVLLGTSFETLINGVITHHQITPSHEPGLSTLTVMGRDLTLLLDLEDANQEYRNQPDNVITTRVLTNYIPHGIIPATIIPTADIPLELFRIPRQHETDLQLIQRLAEHNGYVFYLEPIALGVSNAYWGPDTRIGIPQAPLTLNMGSSTNLTSLNFSNDALAPVSTEGRVLELITRQIVPMPSVPSLRIPPLAREPIRAQRRVQLRQIANRNPAQAAAIASATVSNAPEPVRAEGELDTVQYGHVLRARRLVGVRGAGSSYNGNYYVQRVTHAIAIGHQAAIGQYTQQFTLRREGIGAQFPVV
ncbi:MAG: hypothetical protein HC866_21415 [Leptolyngbyaceae cyanobacterium RU_5_1]|nr:hypothetical protein [Leptolyngbyaceae cyanobacterium RU_5_1]